MANWFLSNFPWKTVGVYSIILTVFSFWILNPAPLFFIFLGVIPLSMYYAITAENYDSILNAEIVILEFIDKRPFKETEYMKKEEILQAILYNVNNQVYRRKGINYGYTSTNALLLTYNSYILKFENKYLKHYKDTPVEEIQGWDKIMLVAKNIQDEDINSAYKSVVSPELIDKYSKKKPMIASKSDGKLLDEHIKKSN
ncbi:unnamed protein product [Debaryomyces tyrocola]|nr:unnamed protein product [Debaryomyces tyrocola]